MVALFRFRHEGTAVSVITVGLQFGISEEAVQVYSDRVLEALLSLEKTVVNWPKPLERLKG